MARDASSARELGGQETSAPRPGSQLSPSRSRSQRSSPDTAVAVSLSHFLGAGARRGGAGAGKEGLRRAEFQSPAVCRSPPAAGCWLGAFSNACSLRLWPPGKLGREDGLLHAKPLAQNRCGSFLCSFLSPKATNRGVQPVTRGHMRPGMAMNEAQHKIVNLLETFFCPSVFVSVVDLMCGPRQLFFSQCGSETPKGWTPLRGQEQIQVQGSIMLLLSNRFNLSFPSACKH